MDRERRTAMNRPLLAACTAFLVAMAADAEGDSLKAPVRPEAKPPEPTASHLVPVCF